MVSDCTRYPRSKVCAEHLRTSYQHVEIRQTPPLHRSGPGLKGRGRRFRRAGTRMDVRGWAVDTCPGVTADDGRAVKSKQSRGVRVAPSQHC